MLKISIKPLEHGPFRLSVDTDEDKVENILFDSRGKSIAIRRSNILCRCGKSRRQPFCDGVHRMSGFKTEQYEDIEISNIKKITVVKNGPLHVEESTGAKEAKKHSLCRCGGSNDKLFCDQTHISLKAKNYTF